MPSRGHGWGHGFAGGASLPYGPAARCSAGNADRPTSSPRLLATAPVEPAGKNLAVVRTARAGVLGRPASRRGAGPHSEAGLKDFGEDGDPLIRAPEASRP